MSFIFRALLPFLFLLSALFNKTAFAVQYPERPVTIVVGMAPGGANDTIARLIANELQERLGVAFLVENRPGANSTIATGQVARAKPDGYTLMLVISSHVTNALLYPDLGYVLDDFEPITVIADTPFVLVANKDFEPNDISEFVELARSMDEGSIDFGTPGMASTQHIAMELMDLVADTRMNHVPYRGGAPAQTDLLAGVIPVIFATPTQSLPYIKNGELKPLGVTSLERLEQLPDVPTFAESGLDNYEADVWFGLIAPKDTPKDIINLLSKEVNSILAQEVIQTKLQEMGLSAVGTQPDEFQQLLDQEFEKWSEVIGKADIKLQ